MYRRGDFKALPVLLGGEQHGYRLLLLTSKLI